MAEAKKKETVTYKGKPLVRCGNTLYYGDPAEPFIAMLQILTTKPLGDTTVPDKVSVQILSTDESLHVTRRVIKHTEKNGLYTALSIAAIWLERSLK